MSERIRAVVVGAGPAGLATSRELVRHGVEHVVLERGDRVGYSWSNLYESLTLHTGKHMSALPGLRLPRSAPLFVPREAFVTYLSSYAGKFALPVRTHWKVTAIESLTNTDSRWRVSAATPGGSVELECDDVIV